MKKTMKTITWCLSLSGLLLLAAQPMVFAQGQGMKHDFSVTLGLDMPGKLDLPGQDSTITKKMDIGFSGAFNYTYGVNDMFRFGGGLSGQYPRGLDEDNFPGELFFVEGYGLMKVIFPLGLKYLDVYSTLQLGWSFPFSDNQFKDSLGNQVSLTGDLYWGASLGILIQKHYIVEVFYKAQHGEIEFADQAKEFEYRHFGVGIGYQF